MSTEIPVYSEDTGTMYPTWEDLVAAEGNGWVAVAVISKPTYLWPYVWGPFPTKAEAQRARGRLKYKLRKEQPADITVAYFVRPAWKEKPRG